MNCTVPEDGVNGLRKSERRNLEKSSPRSFVGGVNLYMVNIRNRGNRGNRGDATFSEAKDFVVRRFIRIES